MAMDSFEAAHPQAVVPGTQAQPNPVGDGADVTKLVIGDLQRRSAMGEKKYGTALRLHNGRDALIDLYQELLDGVCYIRQKITEDVDHRADGYVQGVYDCIDILKQWPDAISCRQELITAMKGKSPHD